MADDRDEREAGERPVPDLLDPEHDAAVFRALADRDRRRVCYVLADGGSVSLSELATVLVGWDRVDRGGVATRAERERREGRLHHSDVPLLVDAGLVTRDESSGTVALADLSTSVRDLLRVVRREETGVEMGRTGGDVDDEAVEDDGADVDDGTVEDANGRTDANARTDADGAEENDGSNGDGENAAGPDRGDD